MFSLIKNILFPFLIAPEQLERLSLYKTLERQLYPTTIHGFSVTEIVV
jgi:hypothetical protein